MKILYEDSMPFAAEFLESLGDCQAFNHKHICADDLVHTDILLVRSTTRVNYDLLHKASKLKFVSTATAGINHLDTNYLVARGIQYSSAAGCNATAVAEYVISVLFASADKLRGNLFDKTVGIIGAGQVGTRLSEKLAALGIDYMLCDPPLENQGDTRQFVSLDEALQADIVTLHTPLIEDGAFPTKHLLNADRLAGLNDDQLLINAGRGEVLDNQAALELFKQGKSLNLVLDVWENEPNINLELLPHLMFATAHIAGHTIEGKVRGTEMLYQQVCERLERPCNLSLNNFIAQPEQSIVSADTSLSSHSQIADLVFQVYDVRQDDLDFRARVTKPGQFEYIRKHYAIRREFAAMQVNAGNSVASEAIYGLGFRSV